MVQGAITEKFDLENSVHILENPDHPNTFYKVMLISSSVKETNDDQELGFELKQLKTIPSNHCLYITSFVVTNLLAALFYLDVIDQVIIEMALIMSNK